MRIFAELKRDERGEGSPWAVALVVSRWGTAFRPAFHRTVETNGIIARRVVEFLFAQQEAR